MSFKGLWPSQNAILWIESILIDRLGINLHLHSDNETYIKLQIDDSSNCITLNLSPNVYQPGNSNISCSHWNPRNEGWDAISDKCLPAPGAHSLSSPLIENNHGDYFIGYDILGFMYWMLSRSEEVGRNDLDTHNRFSSDLSHAMKHDYLDRPIVDEWLEILKQVIKKINPDVEFKKNSFKILVSHDVDVPSQYGFRCPTGAFRIAIKRAIKNRSLKDIFLIPWISYRTKNELHVKDPANTFKWLMDVSEANNLKSAFYFICGKTDSTRDANYKITDPAIVKLIHEIKSRGHEIGLHPSYNTYLNPNAICSEANVLREACRRENIIQEAWGGRMHYLRWSHPETMQALNDAKMDYDTTLGYADMPGFRCGTCFEYPAFNIISGEMLQLKIRPLIAMECTIIDKRYMGLGLSDRSKEKFIALKNACRQVNGTFTLLWHNSNLESHEERQLYNYVVSN